MSERNSSPQPVCLDDFEETAKEKINKNALVFFRNGADEEVTLNDNIDAFRRYYIPGKYLYQNL